jgi:hypothetical protein
MKSVKTPWSPLIILVIGVIAMTAITISRNNEFSMLLKKNSLAYGQIKSFGYSIKSSRSSATFYFSVNQKTYQGHFSHSDFCHRLSRVEKDSLRQVKFPVVYYPRDPNINMILLKRKHYEKFKLPYTEDIAAVLEEHFACSKIERFFTYW